MEVWKPIKDFEGKYEVSSIGRISRITLDGTRKILTPQEGFGCYVVALSKNSTKRQYKLHRLVANAFIPNPNNYPVVNHRDGNTANNTVDNLEWCTYRHNATHGMGRPVMLRYIDGTEKLFPSVSSAARSLGVHQANLYYYAKMEVPTKAGIRVFFRDDMKESYKASAFEELLYD